MKRSPFTLVELLAVIAIIIILVGMVIGLAGIAREKAAESKTKMKMKNLELLLEKYKDERGAYPVAETRQDIGTLLNATDATTGKPKFFSKESNGARPYVSDLTGPDSCKDGWKKQIQYYRPSVIDATHLAPQAGAYDLWSLGPNQATGYAPGTATPGTVDGDDLCNWKND